MVREIQLEYDDIILESRGDAQLVLDQMDDLIDTYGVASLADLYEAVGAPYEYTAHNFGWTNIHSAKIQHVSHSPDTHHNSNLVYVCQKGYRGKYLRCYRCE